MNEVNKAINTEIVKKIVSSENSSFTTVEIFNEIKLATFYDDDPTEKENGSIPKTTKEVENADKALLKKIQRKIELWCESGMIYEINDPNFKREPNEHLYKSAEEFLALIRARLIIDKYRQLVEAKVLRKLDDDYELKEGEALSSLEESLKKLNPDQLGEPVSVEDIMNDKADLMDMVVDGEAKKINKIKDKYAIYEDDKSFQRRKDEKLAKGDNVEKLKPRKLNGQYRKLSEEDSEKVEYYKNEGYDRIRKLLKHTASENKLAQYGIDIALKVVNAPNSGLDETNKYGYLKDIKNAVESLDYLNG
jgi:hypothetical protein